MIYGVLLNQHQSTRENTYFYVIQDCDYDLNVRNKYNLSKHINLVSNNNYY